MSKENNNYSIHGIPVLQDNIVWIWAKEKQAVVVDPAVVEPVERWLKAKGISLVGILQTHHHLDHIGGTEGLTNIWPSTAVVASKADKDRIPFQTVSIEHGDEFELMGIPIKVIEVKGHTKAHVAYYLGNDDRSNRHPALFCGDTLFGAGCGRLFEGTVLDMFKSLKRLNALPGNTKIYCAHEYTEANLKWAHSLAPGNKLISKRLTKVMKLRASNLITLPSTLDEERSTNLFLRARTVEEFASLRKNKDSWQG